MENVEDMEIEPGQLDCLDVFPEVTGQFLLPVKVLRKVLENLSNADLLNLSLVNKVWHSEAQSVLRKRGSLTAKMNTAGGGCKVMLRVFASDLRRMRQVRKVVPFSGLTIAISGEYDEHHEDWCEESYSGELDQVYEDILHQMEWKHLALDLSQYSEKGKNCAGFTLVKKILHNCSCDLEDFSLKLESNRQTFIQYFLQDCNFSRLKTMKFRGRRNGGDEDLIKTLVSRAPNLKVLGTEGRVNLNSNLLEGSSAEHVCGYPYDIPDIPESIVGQLRLRDIMVSSFGQDFNLKRLSRMLPMLLHRSRTTLSYMGVDAGSLALLHLMCNGICLENVRNLTVALDCFTWIQPRGRLILKSFDFTRIFSNLLSVLIHFSPVYPLYIKRHCNAIMKMVEQGNAAFIEPVNRTVNIKKLTLPWFRSTPDSLTRFLVEMFPHIEKLVIRASSDVPIVRFWDHWLDLEILDIKVRYFAHDFAIENLDSAFCGIFPEEVAELRERDEEYLERVNIVPVMPSISCLKRLKTFRLFFSGASLDGIDHTSMLSKVTGLIAFKRRPDLTVTLTTNSGWWKRELQPMEPYASVRLTRRL